MSVISIKKGRDIKLKGAAEKTVVTVPFPARAALLPTDFSKNKLRVLVKEGDVVQVGTPLLEDKTNTSIKFVSPASGKVAAIVRGDKRALKQIVVDCDGQQHTVNCASISADASRDQIIDAMLAAGLWPIIRQRPFSKIATPADQPKSIFVHAMNTEPLALDIDVVIDEQAQEFQLGLDILNKLTEGTIYLCYKEGATSKALTDAKHVDKYKFKGPHPTGNVSTHIHHIDPIRKGDIVWYVEAQDVIRLGRTFTQGHYDPINYVAVTGEGAENRHYVKTIVGASIESLVVKMSEKYRYISGSVLAGVNAGMSGFVGYYHSQVTVIPEGGERRFLGWLVPGFSKYTFSKTFASAVLPETEVSLDADENGGHRAIVLNSIYDQYNTLNIMTYFLLRSVIAGEIEEAEAHGILECDEEDFALATFCCPSKTNVGAIIKDGLDLIDREG